MPHNFPSKTIIQGYPSYYYMTSAARGPTTKINQSDCSVAGLKFLSIGPGYRDVASICHRQKCKCSTRVLWAKVAAFLWL